MDMDAKLLVFNAN